MGGHRSLSSYEVLLYDFSNEVYVVCPSCQGKAIVKAKNVFDTDVRMICMACGFSKVSASKVTAVVFGGNGDPYFGLPLWLMTSVGNHVFWAYNYEHLDFIKQFVSAKLRERDIDNNRNKSLGSRLPKWMTAAKNRELMLKTVAKLEKK